MKKIIFGGPEAYCSRDEANIIVLPVPFELSTSYIKGTSKGPDAILNASAYMELYDEELNIETYKLGIYTAKNLSSARNAEAWLKSITSGTIGILKKNKFPVILGGEHTVSIGAVRACQQYGIADLSVLQSDAHADLRDSYEKNKLSHACVARRVSEICPVTQVGIRSLSAEEAKFKKNSNVTAFYASTNLNSETLNKIIASLTKNVYITIDLDAFDPAFLPAVGTPEPGGLNWYEVLNILRAVCAQKKIVGFDVVELCPLRRDVRSDFLAAKLIYKLIGYILGGGL